MKDTVIVHHWISSGWPKTFLKMWPCVPFFHRQKWVKCGEWLFVVGEQDGGAWKGEERVLTMLHQAHQGMSKMKALVRCYFWLLKMNREIEACVKGLWAVPSEPQSTSYVVPLRPWSYPNRPWSHIHVNYNSPFMGKQFLLVSDAHTKWLGVHRTSTTSPAAKVEVLRQSSDFQNLWCLTMWLASREKSLKQLGKQTE